MPIMSRSILHRPSAEDGRLFVPLAPRRGRSAKRVADVAEAYYGAQLLLYYNCCATGGRQGLTSRSAIPRISMASTQARQRSTMSLTECGPSPVGRRRRKRPFAPQAELLADGVYAKRDVKRWDSKGWIQKTGYSPNPAASAPDLPVCPGTKPPAVSPKPSAHHRDLCRRDDERQARGVRLRKAPGRLDPNGRSGWDGSRAGEDPRYWGEAESHCVRREAITALERLPKLRGSSVLTKPSNTHIGGRDSPQGQRG